MSFPKYKIVSEVKLTKKIKLILPNILYFSIPDKNRQKKSWNKFKKSKKVP